MRFIRKILEWALLLTIGFIVGLLFGPQIVEEITPFEEIQQTTILESNIENKQLQRERPRLTNFLAPSPDSVDASIIEENIFESVNELRTELGLNHVEKNNILKEAANIRAIETEESFSHTRPNGQDPFSVLQEIETEYFYEMIGENLAMATYIGDENAMSELIMEGWMDSEDHYETMINPHYNEIGIGVHYDGEILYVTQFFGKHR